MFCVGTMSSATGWETKSPENALYWHFYYWFVSRESQSTLVDKVPSFYALWKRYGEKQDTMVTAANEFLKKYIDELFPGSTVVCTAEVVDNTESLYNLVANVKVTYNGVNYSLAKVVEVRPDGFDLLEKHRMGS